MSRDLEKRLRRSSAADFPVSEYLNSAALDPERRGLLTSFVQGFHAADPDRLSARSLAGAGRGGRSAANSAF